MRKIYLIGMVFFIVGCGSSEVPTNILEESFPSSVTLNIPLKLEANREMLTAQSTKSYAYETMQSELLNHRDKSSELEFNMELIRKVIPEIEDFCRDSLIMESCIIPKETFSIKLTNPELRALKKRHAALDIIFDNNTSLPIGEIIMIKKEEESLYSYQLEVDMLGIYQIIMGEVYERFYERKILKRRQYVSWSRDDRNTYVALEEESNLSKEYFNMEFMQSEDDKEVTHFYSFDEYLWSSGSNTLTWIKNNDKNNSYTFHYNDSYNALYAEVSDDVGFHLTSTFYDNTQIAIFFNHEGYELGQYGCGGYDECLLDDKSTWSTEFEAEYNASILDEEFQLFARNIIDENTSLEDGEYFLLSDEILLSENINEEVLYNNIGTFLVNSSQAQGVIYNPDFIDSFDNVKIYKALSLSYSRSRYKEIDEDKYPNFIVQNEIKEEEYSWYE